jgi:hypothetical protein
MYTSQLCFSPDMIAYLNTAKFTLEQGSLSSEDLRLCPAGRSLGWHLQPYKMQRGN